MGHPQVVTAEGHREHGVGGGVDDAQPNAVPRTGDERLGVRWHTAVDQVERIRDVAAIHAHTAHPTHAAHVVVHPHTHRPVARAPGRNEASHDLRRVRADTIGPVVKDQHPLGVVVARLGGVVDDERGVQAVVELQAVVRVEPVGAGIGDDEVEREPGTGGGLRCGDPWDAVHVVADGQAMPVHARRLGQVVAEVDDHPVPRGGAEGLAGDRGAVRPGIDDGPAEVDLDRSGAERQPSSGPTGRTGCFARGDCRSPHRRTRGARTTRRKAQGRPGSGSEDQERATVQQAHDPPSPPARMI